MIPITIWLIKNPTKFNIFAWFGDLILLHDGNIALCIGIILFGFAHQSNIKFNPMLHIVILYIFINPLSSLLIWYALILSSSLYSHQSLGILSMIISDFIIGLTFIFKIPYADTLTIGTYWLGHHFLNNLSN